MWGLLSYSLIHYLPYSQDVPLAETFVFSMNLNFPYFSKGKSEITVYAGCPRWTQIRYDILFTGYLAK